MADVEQTVQTPKKRRWWRWFKRIALSLLTLVVLLIAFHRPLIHHGGRWIAIQAAARANLKLDLQISGTVYDRLVVSNVSAIATGPSAVRTLRIGLIDVRYSLGDLIRKGTHEALKSIAVRNVEAEIDPSLAPLRRLKKLERADQPVTLPAWFPAQLELTNINVVAKQPRGTTDVQALTFTLYPDKPGELRFRRLADPIVGILEDIAATTQFRDKNLQLSGLSLGPEIRTDTINLDASHLAGDEIGLRVAGTFFGGPGQLVVRLYDIRRALKVDAELTADSVAMTQIGNRFNAPALRGNLQRVVARFEGDPTLPPTWTGNADLEFTTPGFDKTSVDGAVLNVKIADGKLKLTSASVRQGQSELKIDAVAALPARVSELNQTAATGRFTLRSPNLAEAATHFGLNNLAGDATAEGTFDLKDGRLVANAAIRGNQLSYQANRLSTTTVNITLTKQLRTTESPAMFYDGLEASVKAVVSGVQPAGYQAETVTLEFTAKGPRVELRNLDVTQQGNRLQASGSYVMPRDLKRLATGEAEAKFALTAPNLAAFAPDLSGAVEAAGTFTQKGERTDGKIKVQGSQIKFRQFTAQQLQASASIAGTDVVVEKLDILLQDQDFIRAEGKLSTRQPIPYSGTLNANVRDLSVFQPILDTMGRKEKLAGSLHVAWKGSGAVNTVEHTGDVTLNVTKGTFGPTTDIETSIAGTYSPQFIDLPKFSMSSSRGSFSTVVSLRESKLMIRDLAYMQGGMQFLTANVTMPFDLGKLRQPKTLFSNDAEVSIEVASNKLDLKKLAEQFHKPVHVSGLVTGNLTVKGSLNKPNAVLTVEGRELQSPKYPTLAPATFDMKLRLIDDRLDVDAAITQPEFLPLAIKGYVPFNLPKTIAAKKVKLDAPLNVNINMPKSQIGFLSKIVKPVRYLEGDATIDVKVTGTIEKPKFAGTAVLNIPAMRFRNPKTPAISSLNTSLAFANNQLEVRQCSGEIGGGPFNLTGRVNLVKPAEPEFDLRLTAKQMAVLRNDSLTVRLNADLAAVGPLKAGKVTGVIGVTDSRFFRDVDILPISLPGRPAAKAKRPAKKAVAATPAGAASAPGRTGPLFSLGPPFNNWVFDVKVRTDTPFLVRGNLARGSANADMVLAGTGAAPTLTGVSQVENLAATLPFSRLNVETGYAYFSPDTGSNPRLDIHATSTIRSYTVHVYITGYADNPQTLFTSEPPLPQEDIIALLSTGTTTEELTGSPEVLAGRAAALLFQKAYRKVFKSKEPTEEKSTLDRFNLETFGVGPSGNQAVVATFMLGEHFHLVGELDVEGGVGGRLQYVIRFR